ncbi:nuclear transport factor 2 family protein [Methyloceanibacter sp.]|uniref:nuclear transport factor 2 family protein n=1 Tax=Methyloceanibacter sp. TaxID=1965321 RepID=UPI002D422E7A|nr:nuclear transport factor 2 family protein [Methyloceanibacter sp.]HZP10419.1 nuclear transport factor 2 family protein [Methyloceanibacter sp.]
MAKSSEALLTDFYDAWRAHDLDLMGTYLPDDFSHLLNIPPETLSVGGERLGKRASLMRLAEIFDGFDTQYLEPGRMIVRDAQAIVEVHTRCKHRASGVWLDTRKQHVWLLEDGWPVKLSEFYDLEQFKTFINRARR